MGNAQPREIVRRKGSEIWRETQKLNLSAHVVDPSQAHARLGHRANLINALILCATLFATTTGKGMLQLHDWLNSGYLIPIVFCSPSGQKPHLVGKCRAKRAAAKI